MLKIQIIGSVNASASIKIRAKFTSSIVFEKSGEEAIRSWMLQNTDIVQIFHCFLCFLYPSLGNCGVLNV